MIISIIFKFNIKIYKLKQRLITILCSNLETKYIFNYIVLMNLKYFIVILL